MRLTAAADRAAAGRAGAAYRHAIEHGAGTFEDFNPLDEICAGGIVRRDPGKAVQGKIAAVVVEAANKQTVGAATRRLNDADRGIVRENVTDGPGLLICNQLRRVISLVERRIHHAAIAEQFRGSRPSPLVRQHREPEAHREFQSKALRKAPVQPAEAPAPQHAAARVTWTFAISVPRAARAAGLEHRP